MKDDKTKVQESKVTCMVCGIEGNPKFMAHVGNNAYKCAYCLFNNSNKEK